jgi:hypothetical protein
VSHVTPRWVLGTAKLRACTFLKDLRGRLRRRPSSATIVPRPPRLSRDARRLRLSHVLVASDLNPEYVDMWHLARRAWASVAHLEVVLVLVADRADVPQALRGDGQVRVFEPITGLHTAFQAQCIRLLYPALLEETDGVLVADIDMLPMNAQYFHRPARGVHETHFVCYRDVLLGEHELPVCYNAALPRTWREIFEVETLADVRVRLSAWADGVMYDGTRGGPGWATDQRILYRALTEFGQRTERVWILDDHYTGFRRLDRGELYKQGELTPRHHRLIERGAYSDFHAPLPMSRFGELNERVVSLAAAAERQRARKT